MLLGSLSSAATGTLYVVVLPAFIAFVGTLVTVGAGWVKDRSRSAKHLRRIEIAKNEVQFWKDWMSAVEPMVQSNGLEDYKKLALRHIERASVALQERQLPKEWTRDSYIEYRKLQPLWRKVTLSYPAGRAMILPRIHYRMVSVLFALEAIGILAYRWHRSPIHHPTRTLLIVFLLWFFASVCLLFLARIAELPLLHKIRGPRRKRLGEF